jgi:hypothetical protein
LLPRTKHSEADVNGGRRARYIRIGGLRDVLSSIIRTRWALNVEATPMEKGPYGVAGFPPNPRNCVAAIFLCAASCRDRAASYCTCLHTQRWFTHGLFILHSSLYDLWIHHTELRIRASGPSYGAVKRPILGVVYGILRNTDAVTH